MPQIKGIDVSTHQGYFNWDSVKANIDFAVVRAGYGGGGVDSQFRRNWSELRRLKIPRMVYFFAYPSRGSGKQQAEEFFNIVGRLQKGEGIVLDIEDETAYGRGLVPSDVNWCKEFLDTAKELFGVKGLIYMNSNVLSRYDWSSVKNADYGLWIANYGVNNGRPGREPSSGIWDFWAMWQYTSVGSVNGIAPLDMNLFNGDVETFKKYGYGEAGKATQPVNKPKPIIKPAPAPALVTTYRVLQGDTLSVIARKFGTTAEALGRINNIKDLNMIYAGDILRISSVNTSNPKARYIVARGDTLSEIAAKHGTTADKLAKINNIPNKNLIYAGQVIKLR